MNSQFSNCFKISTVAHFAAVGLLLLVPVFVRVFRSDSSLSRQTEFMVDVSSLQGSSGRTSAGQSADVTSFRIKKIRKRNLIPKKEEPKPDEAEVKNQAVKSSPITVKQQVNNSGVQPGYGKKLTPEEIQRWMNLGATAGDHNSILEGDALYEEIIKRACYNAWNQPSYQEVGRATAEVTIKFLPDGTIVDVTMTRKTGNAAMDGSVMQAVNSLKRIDGLSPDFLRYNSPVIVSFRVTFE